MQKYVNMVKIIIMVVCKKAINIAKHPQTKKIGKFVFKQITKALKTKIGRGIALL